MPINLQWKEGEPGENGNAAVAAGCPCLAWLRAVDTKLSSAPSPLPSPLQSQPSQQDSQYPAIELELVLAIVTEAAAAAALAGKCGWAHGRDGTGQDTRRIPIA